MDPTVLTRVASNCQHIMVTTIGLIVQAHVHMHLKMAAQVLPQRTGMGALWQGSKNPRAWNLRTLASTAASQKSVVRSRVSPQALSKSPSLLCLNQPQPTSLSILTHINRMSKLGGKCCFHFWKTNSDLMNSSSKKTQIWLAKPYNLCALGLKKNSPRFSKSHRCAKRKHNLLFSEMFLPHLYLNSLSYFPIMGTV